MARDCHSRKFRGFRGRKPSRAAGASKA